MTVLALGAVDAAIVSPILGPDVRYVENPTADDYKKAVGVIARAAAVVDRSLIDSMPNLKVIARTGVGTELVDLVAASERGIPVVVTPGANSRAVAEGTLAHILHLVKRLGPLTSLVQSERWNERTKYPVGDLFGQTVGIVGLGRIGTLLADYCSALGMQVLAFDPYAQVPPAMKVQDVNELFKNSDVISLHLPLTPQTEHLINHSAINSMRDGVIIVNCGRGALIDLDAALVGLQSGKIGGLGLDVFDPEPPQRHEIFLHENVVLTPHVMGLSIQSTQTTFIDAAQGVADVLQGRTPKAIANPTQETGRNT